MGDTQNGAQVPPEAPKTDGTPAAGTPPAEGTKTETPPATDPTAGAEGQKTGDGVQPATADGDGAQKATEGTPDGAAAAASKVPEQYALTVPDGALVDADDLAAFKDAAKKAGLSNEAAQAVLDDTIAQAAAQSARWRAATEADPDYGGDKLAESKRLADTVINKVRPAGHPRREAFLRFLNKAGAGNHLEVVAFMADLGRLMAEDGPEGTTTTGAAKSARTAEEVLYGGS